MIDSNNPWYRFLSARAEAIDYLTSKGYSDEDIASYLSIDMEQLYQIRKREREPLE